MVKICYDSDPINPVRDTVYIHTRDTLCIRDTVTVIGADTLVFLEGFPLGKPEDEEEARSMLRKLSGRTHHVCTAVAIRSPLGMKNLAVLTEVTFRKLTEKDIRHYMELVDVMDKAGSYAFQEHGEMIISSVRGDTDNVIGLPVRDVMKCLNDLGYRV